MRKRKLGNTALEFSTIGFGTWALGGANWKASWGPQDDNDSIAAIRRAIELGVNWIDTAQIYGLGHSEEVVGQALEGVKERIYIATKCGRAQTPEKGLHGDLSPEKVRRDCEESLKRLRVDCIDLYQIHWPQPEEQIEGAWETIAKLRDEGKLRHAGVSNFAVAQMKRLQRIHPISSLQPPYSMLRRDIEIPQPGQPSIVEYCRQEKIGIIPYGTMQHSLLTGTMTRERLADLPKEDFRHNNTSFKEPLLTANLQFVEGLKLLAARLHTSCAHLAIAWVLRIPEVTSAIVGARRPAQIEETYRAAEATLSSDTLKEIAGLIDIRDKQIAV